MRIHVSFTHAFTQSLIHSLNVLTYNFSNTHTHTATQTHTYTHKQTLTHTHTYTNTHTPRAGALRVRRQFLRHLWYSSSLCCCCGGGVVPSRVFCFGRRQEQRLCMLDWCVSGSTPQWQRKNPYQLCLFREIEELTVTNATARVLSCVRDVDVTYNVGRNQLYVRRSGFLYRAYITCIFLQPVSSGTLHNLHVFHHDETSCAVWLFLIMHSSLNESSLCLCHAAQSCTNLRTIASVLLWAPSRCRLHDILQIRRFNLGLHLPRSPLDAH